MAVFFVVFCFVIVAGYGIAFTRKGKVGADTIPWRRRELFTPADAATAFARIAAIGGGKIRVDDQDAAQNVVILSSPVTFFTWGFLYPVYLHNSDHGTRIVVGCKSKFFQLGPLVTRAHDECVAAIESALSIPTARIA